MGELNFADSVEVRCPELQREPGDSVICTGRSAAGNVVLFEVSVDDERQLTLEDRRLISRSGFCVNLGSRSVRERDTGPRQVSHPLDTKEFSWSS